MNPSRLLGFVCAAALLLLLAFAQGCAPKPNYAGTWNGTITFTLPGAPQSMQVPIVFKVTKKDDGTYSATASLGPQGGASLPVDKFAVEDKKVTISITAQGQTALFSGTVNAEANSITGNFTQGKNSVPLTLSKQPDAAK
jgi:hypothetical protein